MTAPRTFAPKPGRRQTAAPKRVTPVESIPCPATLGSETHVLVWRRGVVACAWCLESWASLDQAAREAS